MYKDFTKYEVFEDGRIWSYKSKKWLKPITMKNGYQRVWLSNNEGKIKMYLIHRVVYQAVSGEEIPDGMQVNHINEDKTDNRFSNLNLMTPKENTNWGSARERMIKAQNKQVGAFKDGKLVMTFQSVNEASRNGFHSSAVSKCCNGKRKTHKGFEWRYL